MVQLEFNFNERKKQTAVDWLVNKIYMVIPNEERNFLEGLREQAEQIEEQRIKDAIMYALDEDGHTGEWKIKFANNYINNLKQTK